MLKGRMLILGLSLLIAGNASLVEAETSAKIRDHSMKSETELKEVLTAEQFRVTKENGTERPFSNAYWDNKKQGIYVDVISGKPLFSSTTKFESGTGWPSFTAPLDKDEVVEIEDSTFGMRRTEVRSKTADAHLGHVFNDGPGDGGLRYCINSASLRFIEIDDLKKEGYEEFQKLFEK